jgi:phosphoglycerate dehydrogenase-like enzyme
VPVAEYALGAILLSLKHFWRFAGLARQGLGWEPERPALPPGAYRSAVGLISFGMVARKLNELLRAFDLDRLVACPFLRPEEAGEHGVELCALPDLFRRSDVVSLHTPDLPETRGMITGELIASMKPGATFLNTARGAVVRQEEMIEALLARPDLTAILDVTHPEPPEPDSRLLSLPNVVLTPHIAGSLGAECRRMGRYMAEELQRYLAGKPLRWGISREQAAKLA